jgi:hypothetical protein
MHQLLNSIIIIVLIEGLNFLHGKAWLRQENALMLPELKISMGLVTCFFASQCFSPLGLNAEIFRHMRLILLAFFAW